MVWIKQQKRITARCGVTIGVLKGELTRCSSGLIVIQRVGQGTVVTQHIRSLVIYGHTPARVYRSVISHITRNAHIVLSLSHRPSKSLTVPPTGLPVCEDQDTKYGNAWTHTRPNLKHYVHFNV